MKGLKLHQFALGITLAAFITLAFKSAYIPDHKYSLVLTEKEWGARLGFIQNAMIIMRTSTVPGNQISAAQDSLIKFQQEIQAQIGSQIQADTIVKVKK